MGKVVSRNQILIRTSWISTIGNAILSAAKIVLGIISGSLAVISDGIDSLMDVVISIVMIFTANIMKRPPSEKYVFGYEKAEAIATKILSLIIFYAGVQMFIFSIQKTLESDNQKLPSKLAIYVTIFSIIGKLLLAFYQHKQGKRTKSSMLIANAINMRNDVLISAGVLIGLFFSFILDLPLLDSIVSLIISVFIIKSAISIFMDSNVELMDGIKDTSVYDKIFIAVNNVPGASNPHRMRSRQVGNMYIITLDIEVDGNITVDTAHKIAESVEKSIKDTVENVYDIVVHIEPKNGKHSKEKFGVKR